MRAAFIIDPVELLNPMTDTSLALVRAALARGDQVWTMGAPSLEAVQGRARARARAVAVPWHAIADESHVWLDEMDVVFMRTDPPVDQAYLSATYVLDLVDPARTALVNDPRGLRQCNEKTYALRFPELVPATVVTADALTIADFIAEHGRAVLKPVRGHGGRGVLVLDPADPNLRSLVEVSTRRGRRAVVVQRFLTEVSEGNKRLFLFDGSPTAAVWRRPMPGDFRTGDPTSAAPVTARDREICARLAPSLCADGLRMVGLDVIGGQLIEVNVTSPGALHKTDVLLGTTLCADVLDAIAGPR